MADDSVENIIFDLGNTLIYFDYCYFFDRVALHEKKVNARKLKRYFIDKKFGYKLAKGTISPKDFFKILKKKFNLKIGYSDFIFFYSDIFWANTPMKNFLERISKVKRFKLFLLSNTDPAHLNFIDKNFTFVRLLKKRILSYKVRMNKPEKKLFRYTLEKFNLIPEKTLLIDDLKDNILSASSLGIKTIHYSNHKAFLKRFSALARKVKKIKN